MNHNMNSRVQWELHEIHYNAHTTMTIERQTAMNGYRLITDLNLDLVRPSNAVPNKSDSLCFEIKLIDWIDFLQNKNNGFKWR